MDKEELKKLLAEFKEANDKRLEAIENKGKADPLLEKKVDDLNAKISKGQEEMAAKFKESQEDITARMDEVELNAGREGLNGGTQVADIKSQAENFCSLVNVARPRNAQFKEVTVDDYKAYSSAFFNYLSMGEVGLEVDIKNSLSVGSDPSGGFRVMPTISSVIATRLFESSPMRNMATIQPCGTDSVKGLIDAEDIETAGWAGEKSERKGTGTPDIGEWEIKLFEQYAQPKITQQALDDTVFPIEQWLISKIADKFARVEGHAFIHGNGILKPRGILTYGNGTKWGEIEQIKSKVNGKVTTNSFLDLIYGMKGVYLNGASLMMHRTTIAEARKLKDGEDRYIWLPDFSKPGAGTIMGIPVVEADTMPMLSNGSLSVALANFRLAYMIAERPGMSVLRDPFTEKPYIKIYTTKRVGGGVINFDSIKLMKSSA